MSLQHSSTPLPFSSDPGEPPMIVVAQATAASPLPGVKRLSGPEAALIAAIFTVALLLHLTGMTLADELELLAATGAIAAFVVAAATGRISVRALAKKVGKLAESEEG